MFAMKRFCGVPICTPNKLLYGETGRYLLMLKTAIKCIRYWSKITMLPISRLNKQAYKMLYAQNDRGKINWATYVQQLLVENGFEIVRMFQQVGSIELFTSEFKDRLICTFQQNWHWEISQKDRYSWYFSFKDIF
jgi:hypothetical protein